MTYSLDHVLHHTFIDWVLSDTASISLSLMAFSLMGLYVIQFFLTTDAFVINKGVRKNHLVMRALNWGILGGVFLLFGKIIPFEDVLTWRATARVALVFLMAPEVAYQLTVLWPTAKRILWKKTSRQ